MSIVKEFIETDPGRFSISTAPLKDRRSRRKRSSHDLRHDPDSLWGSAWGRMLCEKDLKDPSSWIAKKFRRRFRLPYSVFLLLVQKCKHAQVFGASRIPTEFKVMVALRILGRGNCADDINELSNIGESTCNVIFHQFCKGMVDSLYNEYVSFPSGEDLKVVEKTYAKFGFPGACGSQDATHLRLGKCPQALTVMATGKEQYPTLAFQCVCGPNRKIFHCSEAYLGSFNDMTITAHDDLCQSIRGGLLDEVESTCIDADGVPRIVKGRYLIVDGGYPKESWLMDPFGLACTMEEKRYSEWLESVRKDIECAFGIIKGRFRLFMQAIQFHKFHQIENAWKAAIMLHNMLISYDGNDLTDWERNFGKREGFNYNFFGLRVCFFW